MTSADMITSLASMTSTASLASDNKKQHALDIPSDFPGIRNLSGLNDLNSLHSLSGLIELSSLNSSKKNTEIEVSINPGTKMSYSGLLIWLGLTKIHYFIDFLAPFLSEAVEDRGVTFKQIKGSYIKFPLLRIPKPPSN